MTESKYFVVEGFLRKYVGRYEMNLFVHEQGKHLEAPSHHMRNERIQLLSALKVTVGARVTCDDHVVVSLKESGLRGRGLDTKPMLWGSDEMDKALSEWFKLW